MQETVDRNLVGRKQLANSFEGPKEDNIQSRIRFFFFLIKPTAALISQIYFYQETVHVSGSSSAHHQEFSTVHSALVCAVQI